MFTFTNRFGDAVDVPSVEDLPALDASNVANLPLWIAAATEAEERQFCDHYDRIAEAVGGPSRDDLKELGFLPSEFSITLTRRVPVVVWVDQTTEVSIKANSEAEAEEKALAPHVAYWGGGMYGDSIITGMADRYAYHGLLVDESRPWGDPEVKRS